MCDDYTRLTGALSDINEALHDAADCHGTRRGNVRAVRPGESDHADAAPALADAVRGVLTRPDASVAAGEPA
ncbi:hypothetical protein RKE30_15905 [Streptomyces sp. Li-HN-5-11]|uniref:hypothetical protein n=1 Tax=Streptomyces sp. Li-HN-5-11 TaxID=3075432 RepID=UPI0028A67022|nr:hypothetical protein [Streptomyces sp. Li-HN-5-11]WNM31784.1 hypothetical protein RKE30_15905 [Streptomyces sp. Li-HN-5-11]